MDTVLLRRVIFTLNTVEVRGKENMGSLIGCINVLEGIVQEEELAQAKAAAVRESEERDGG